MATPRVAEPAEHREEVLDLVGRQRRGRLVEHEHLRRPLVVVDRAGDGEAGPLGQAE